MKMTEIKTEIKTAKAPLPKGAYSQGIRIGDTVYISGQLPIDPNTNEPLNGSIESQIHQAFKNVEAVLEAAGIGFDNVVKVTIYISDIKYWELVNEIYQHYICSPILPSRTVVPTKQLHYGLPIEIDAIAYIS